MTKVEKFRYEPDGRVLSEFFWDRSPVSIIQGPVGSGTSTACCLKMWKIATEQAYDRFGDRRTRWYIVRNTYNDLKGTTLKTWKDWFEHIPRGAFGEVKMTNPPEHNIVWKLPDHTVVKAEFIFLALDNEDDVRKLTSAEVTGIWFNECQFTQKEIFDMGHSRAMQGRYPPKRDSPATWKGVIADLNAPPEGHWLPYLRGDVPLPDEWDDDQRREYTCPDDWRVDFIQPPGLLEIIEDGRVTGYEENNRENREKRGLADVEAVAENTRWLEETYENLIKGKSKAYIDTYVMNRVGAYQAGRAVFESYRPEIHVAKSKIEYNPLLPLIVGMDFARNPAAVAIQILRGTVYVLAEWGVENMAATTYAPLLRQFLFRRFPEAFREGSAGLQVWGDPTGDSKGQGTDDTPYKICRKNGIMVVAAPGNNAISLRLEAVQSQLDKMIEGRPGYLSDRRNVSLNAAMAGQYHFARIKGQHRFHDAPNKTRAADFADALQYACLGAGLGIGVITSGIKKADGARKEKKKFSLRSRR